MVNKHLLPWGFVKFLTEQNPEIKFVAVDVDDGDDDDDDNDFRFQYWSEISDNLDLLSKHVITHNRFCLHSETKSEQIVSTSIASNEITFNTLLWFLSRGISPDT